MSEINLEEKLCKNLEDSCIKAYKAGQQSMQAEIDQLNSVLDERTKEWLQAIECGTYFENVAKPLKAENDSLKTQLNNMEACYIQKNKEYEGLQDRVEGVLGKMLTKAESLQQGCDGYIDPVELCQAEGIDMCVRFLEKALRGEHE